MYVNNNLLIYLYKLFHTERLEVLLAERIMYVHVTWHKLRVGVLGRVSSLPALKGYRFFLFSFIFWYWRRNPNIGPENTNTNPWKGNNKSVVDLDLAPECMISFSFLSSEVPKKWWVVSFTQFYHFTNKFRVFLLFLHYDQKK